MLSQVFHELLEFVLRHIKFILRSRELALQVLHLPDLDVDLPLQASYLLVIVGDLALHLGLGRLQRCDLVRLSSILVVELLIDGLEACELRQCSFILCLKITMHRVHVI